MRPRLPAVRRALLSRPLSAEAGRRRPEQITPSTGLAWNTVRKYLAQVGQPSRTPAAAGAAASRAVGQGERELPGAGGAGACTELEAQLRELHDEIVAGLTESTATTVWQRLRDAGRLRCSITSFRRNLCREVREVDPQRWW